MKTFDFTEATISYQLKDPHSKALEPDRLSPSASNYDTASNGEGEEVRESLKYFLVGLKSLNLKSWLQSPPS
jgi:hypothetical protein